MTTSYQNVPQCPVVQFYSTLSAFPLIGFDGVIFLARDTGTTYYWTGTSYALCGDGAVGAHNSLSGLQGGTSGQYYHLTAAEYAALGTAAVFPVIAGDPSTPTNGQGWYNSTAKEVRVRVDGVTYKLPCSPV